MRKAITFAEVLAKAGSGTPGITGWFHRLDAETQAELSAIKDAWLAGGRKPPKNTFARALISLYKAQGVEIAGQTQVTRWLAGESQ
jgi:hypothetical protein